MNIKQLKVTKIEFYLWLVIAVIIVILAVFKMIQLERVTRENNTILRNAERLLEKNKQGLENIEKLYKIIERQLDPLKKREEVRRWSGDPAALVATGSCTLDEEFLPGQIKALRPVRVSYPT